MIKLTRVEGTDIHINANYIVKVEDLDGEAGTRIVLHDGYTFRASNDCQTVLARIHKATQ